jgi:hypothetical protein
MEMEFREDWSTVSVLTKNGKEKGKTVNFIIQELFTQSEISEYEINSVGIVMDGLLSLPRILISI